MENDELEKKREDLKKIGEDENLLLKLTDREFLKEQNIYEIMILVEKLSSKDKKSLLQNDSFLKEGKITDYDIKKIIDSLDEKDKYEILSDINFIRENLNLPDYKINQIISELQSEKSKLEFIEKYDIQNEDKIEIMKSFSEESKLEYIKQNEEALSSSNIENLIASFSVDSIIKYIKENEKIFDKKGIKPYNIMLLSEIDIQTELAKRIDETGLNLVEKKKMLISMNKRAKESLNLEDFSEEYRKVLQLKVFDSMIYSKIGKIKVNFHGNLEVYKGLDELIYINPQELSKEEEKGLEELYKICPSIKIRDNLDAGESTFEEFFLAEEWVKKVITGINYKWSNIQKVAYIDNAIGKKISYSPDYDTEIFNPESSRALWKIIAKEEGVCNGIAHIEKYLFDLIGIESEVVSSRNHSFLRLNNITIPTVHGKITGNTILDPTWNLSNHRYGYIPTDFCRSYEEIRKNDITEDGIDRCCHKNDEKLEDCKLDICEKELRNVFKSIGLTDRKGLFPVKKLLDNLESINLTDEQALKKGLKCLEDYYPQFATCNNSTSDILFTVISKLKLNIDKCIINRVYAKKDESKKTIVYVYMKFENGKKNFYYADKSSNHFVNLPQEEFEEKFECYKSDIEKQCGYRPWDDQTEKIIDIDDINRSKVASFEDEER